MIKKKVLVTGGAGFIGSNIVRHLVKNGIDVVVLDNFSSGFHENLRDFYDLNIIEGDIRNEKVVKRAIKGVDTVYHLAASVGNKRSIDFPLTDAQINVIGTINILEAARKEGVSKIVTSSSAGIFGELKSLPIRENHVIEPDTPYGCTKLAKEKLCLSYAKLYDIEAICLRYFNVYGPNQRFDTYGNVIPIFIHKVLHNEPIIIYGDGNQTRDFIYVDDVVQANIKAGKSSGVNGAFNIGSGKSISINDLVGIIQKNLNGKGRIKYKSKRAGDVLHSLADINLARQLIHFDPKVDIDEGIVRYIEWAIDYYEK